MTSPSLKATRALEKKPAAQPLSRKCLDDDDNETRVNVSYKKVPRHFYYIYELSHDMRIQT